MYWRVKQNMLDFSLLIDAGNSYNSQDFLSISSKEIIRENLLFRFDDEGRSHKSTFIPTAHIGTICFKPETLSVFGTALELSPHIIYDIKIGNEDASMYAPMKEEFCFDFMNSNYSRYSDGDISVVHDIRLIDGFSSKYHIFRIADDFRLRFEIIVSSLFKSVYDENRMTGLQFSPA